VNLKGLVPAIVTPMKADGAVDEKAMKAYLKWLLPQGPVALALNTDAGEGPHLLPQEKLRVLEVVKAEVAGEVPLICGLAGANTSAMLEFGQKAKRLGADGWLVFPLTAYRGAKGKDPVILEYHRRVASLKLPMVLFQLQADLGGVEYPYETLRELVKLPEVVAIKEATFDISKCQQTVSFLRSLPKRIDILTGNDNFILESFVHGCDGALIGFGAVMVREQADMMRAALAGDWSTAFRLYEAVNPVAQMAFAPPVRNYRARLKEILRLQGVLPSAFVRAPLLGLDKAEKALVKKVSAANNLI
jgi:4-hydroxy-tetrahydrodipicolinate synthase